MCIIHTQHVHHLGWNPHQSSSPNRDELAFLFPSGKTFCEICTYVMAEIWPVCRWEVQMDEKLFCKSHYASMDKVWTVFTSCLIESAMKRLFLSCLFNFSTYNMESCHNAGDHCEKHRKARDPNHAEFGEVWVWTSGVLHEPEEFGRAQQTAPEDR